MLESIVFASKNKGKIREVKQLFAGINVEILPVPDIFDPLENGETFLDNAKIKAIEAVKLTQQAALADDSGLVVDALDGAPGVHSSRYAENDSARIHKLLDAMKNVADDKRTARFVCAMALVDQKGTVLHMTSGVCEGLIIHEPRGSDGFGFDPIFFVSEKNCTLAQIPLEEKNTLSHRAKALKKMLDWIHKNLKGN
jgi:XTP/dITP diphosphohydrolase